MRNFKKNLIFIVLGALVINGFAYADLNKDEVKTYKITANNPEPIADALNNFKVLLLPKTFSSSNELNLIDINEPMNFPWKLEKLSDVYQFDFENKNAYAKNKPIYIQIGYDKKSNYLKKVYYFNRFTDTWKSLPTRDYPKQNYVIAQVPFLFARLAVFADPDFMAVGDASWYRYEYGLFAASPDYSMGTKLRVYNLDNNKSVEVTVNDFGPDRNAYPTRVVDLDIQAFKKISSPSAGIANVLVEPIGITESIESPDIKIKAKSAEIFDSKTGEVVYSKNPNEVRPLASLTKLVAADVFLNTHPDMNKIVKYSVRDENYNYKYVDYKWQVERLRVKDGDTLSIQDLFDSALIGSENNAVESLVRVSGLSRSEFIDKMNQTVASWGATSTHFEEPTGLSPKNVSSAHDYAIIADEVLNNPIIRKTSTMTEYRFTTRNTKKLHIVRNTDNLLLSPDFKITGSKTGYLDEAGHCLMIGAQAKNGDQIIVVTLGEKTKDDSLKETDDLMRYGINKINDNNL